MLEDEATIVYISFVVDISQDFRRFVLPLQTNAPMICMLFNMCRRLIQDILNKFIIHENIMKTTKSKQAQNSVNWI